MKLVSKKMHDEIFHIDTTYLYLQIWVGCVFLEVPNLYAYKEYYL